MPSFRISIAIVSLLLVSLVSVPLALPAVALAADVRGGQSITIGRDEVIDDDLYIAGANVVIDGRVNGDVIAAGQTVLINGEVTGSVWAAGQTVTINGRIGGSARIAGQAGIVNGPVQRDLLFAGQALSLAPGASVGRDVLAAGATANLLGRVGRNIGGSAEEITIGGPVEGRVDVQAGKLVLGPGARIGGDVIYTSRSPLELQPGATVAGRTVHNEPPQREQERPTISIVGKIIGFLVGLAMAFIVGLAIILLAPRFTVRAAENIGLRPWESLGWGAIVLFVVPPILVIIAVTVIGIPLALIGLALYLIAIYIAQVFVAIFIGWWLLNRLTPDTIRTWPAAGPLVLAMVIGLVILSLLREIPFVGWLVTLIVVLLGLGAMALAWRQPRPTVPAPAVPSPAT